MAPFRRFRTSLSFKVAENAQDMLESRDVHEYSYPAMTKTLGEYGNLDIVFGSVS